MLHYVATSTEDNLAQPHNIVPLWSLAGPVAGLGVLALVWPYATGAWAVVAGLVLLLAVIAAVHHAEIVALRVGEPFGTLILALAVTALETGLIVSLMLGAPETSMSLARDSVFAATMLILGGVMGLCILVGASRHREQYFGLYGANAAMSVVTVLALSVFVLPNFTTSARGPTFSDPQMLMLAALCLVLYAAFVTIQTVRHRDYFLPVASDGSLLPPDVHLGKPTVAQAWMAAALLVASLVAVVGLAKSLSTAIDGAMQAIGAPHALLGVVIAALVLLPESIAAVRNARADRIQTSLNLALGSVVATIGLTVPAVLSLAVLFDWTIILGVETKNMVLLGMALLVATQSLATGRTNILQGTVLLVVFVVYVFLTLVP